VAPDSEHDGYVSPDFSELLSGTEDEYPVSRPPPKKTKGRIVQDIEDEEVLALKMLRGGA
jgi:hypothetical protein